MGCFVLYQFESSNENSAFHLVTDYQFNPAIQAGNVTVSGHIQLLHTVCNESIVQRAKGPEQGGST